jgi:hypothetical protein
MPLREAILNSQFKPARPFLCYTLSFFLQPTVYTVSIRQSEKTFNYGIIANRILGSEECIPSHIVSEGNKLLIKH